MKSLDKTSFIQGIWVPDPAVTCLYLQCSSDGAYQHSGCTSHGSSRVRQSDSCPAGYFVCSVAQKLDRDYGADNSGMNGVQGECCFRGNNK